MPRLASSLVLLALLTPLPLRAQDFSHPDTRPAPQTPLIQQANNDLAAGDYPAALKILTSLNTQLPNNPQVLYDLGLTLEALAETGPAASAANASDTSSSNSAPAPASPCSSSSSSSASVQTGPSSADATAAESCYRAAIAADQNFPPPHVALGLLLARTGRPTEARVQLNAALDLPNVPDPLKARVWRALARLDLNGDPAHSLPSNPTAASTDLLAALKLAPEQPEDVLLSAQIAEATPDLAAAERAYRRYLALPGNANDPDATSALAHILLAQHRPADAETLLTPALAAHPEEPSFSAQLAQAWLDSGDPAKAARAVPLVESLHAKNPNNTAITRLLARIYVETGHPDQADPLYASLISLESIHPDPTLLTARADALMRLHRPAEAEKLLQQAIANPHSFPTPDDLVDAATHLAFAASEIDDPRTTLQALALSATVQPPSPSSLFLEATARDALHQSSQAVDSYRKFLAAAAGKYPEQESQARQRLNALQHAK
ncbi:MAG TPA: tetratricopeptide repeat protein [Acidobacteriaceae bacterium]|nr:tetratricopeptide repeat protein [Acidobacteriaceae bacterium]